MRNEAVLVVISDKDGKLFYVQQKDDSYHSVEYRNKYVFFGGGVEIGENAIEAAEREMNEELDDFAYQILKGKIIEKGQIFREIFIENKKVKVKLHICRAILGNDELEKISKLEVKEGKRGILVNEKELMELPFIGNLNHLSKQFFL